MTAAKICRPSVRCLKLFSNQEVELLRSEMQLSIHLFNHIFTEFLLQASIEEDLFRFLILVFETEA